MATTTTHYGFTKPGVNDYVDISVLNANFDNLDNVIYNNQLRAQAALDDLAPEYDATATYSVGDYVTYNKTLYRCITAIATAEAFDDTKWTAVKVGGELKSHDTRISTLDGIRQDNAGFHNSIYRGKFLGTSITAEQYAQISAGTFDDMFIGDYWTISTTFGSTTRNVDYVIAGFDYWWNVGDTFPQGSNKHHIVLVPRGVLYVARMNATNITTGGYVGSEMYTTNLADARTGITNIFSGHLYSVRRVFSNSTDNSGAITGTTVTSSVDLMSEIMVFGSKVWANSGWEVGMDTSILPLFALNPSARNERAYWWLRGCVNSTSFTYVTALGQAGQNGASVEFSYIKPCFAIYGGD